MHISTLLFAKKGIKNIKAKTFPVKNAKILKKLLTFFITYDILNER